MSGRALRHLRLPAILIAFVAGSAVAAAAMFEEPIAEPGKDKVRLCHATGNGQWVSIEVAPEAVTQSGHDGHDEDIIPSFTYEKGNDVTDYPGKNWGGKGQETWDADCVAPEPPKPIEYPIGVFGKATCETGGKTYAVTFGYDSENTVPVRIAIGSSNYVSPGDLDGGQPTEFQPGRVESAFTVKNVPIGVDGSWTLKHGSETRSETVKAPSNCREEPPPTRETVSVHVMCVTKGTSTYTARFGYTNPGSATVSVAVGSLNRFSGEDEDRGQPIAFEPGSDKVAVTVTGIPNGTALTWTLVTDVSRWATAKNSFATSCEPIQPPPDLRPVVAYVACVDAGPSTFTATFGVDNPNSAPVSFPFGPDNGFTPAPDDRGQGTTFAPGRNNTRVTVAVIPNRSELAWTLHGHTATATASFTTSCSEPPPEPPQVEAVRPSVTCVANNETTYEARFGYTNENDSTVAIPVGDDNRFSQAPPGRGQTTEFASGSVASAFTVSGISNGTNLVWVVSHAGETRTATASAAFATKCSGPPPPEPPEPPEPPPPGPPPPDPLPQPEDRPIGVFVACVTPSGGRYDAVFGYQNENPTSVTIAVGDRNRFDPEPVGRGQVTEFLPGNVQRAFAVRGVSASLSVTWSVTNAGVTRSATATASESQRCAEAPEPLAPIGVLACVTPRGDTFDVTFGYDNPNSVAVSVPIGIANAVLPRPISHGQPDVFEPGRVERAFTVRGAPDARLVVWTVAFFGRSSLAVTPSFPIRCGAAPRPEPIAIFPLCARRTGTTYVAVFGYQNLNERNIDVPRGSANRVGPSAHGGRQPSSFRAGLAPIALVIRGVPVGRTVTWTLRTFGEVDVAALSVDSIDCRIAAGTGAPDLAVSKVAEPRSVDAGERVEYTIEVRNAGPSEATQVVAVDRQLGGSVEFRSATTSQGRCELRGATGSQRVVCSLGTLAPGDRASIVVAGRGRLAGTVRNRVTVRSLPRDRDLSNNTADAVVTVRTSAVAGAGNPDFTG